MYEAAVNYWAVLVSALVFFAIGAVWYGPVFGKAWRDAMGMKEEDLEAQKAEVNMVKSFGLMFLGSIIMTLTLAHLLGYMAFVFPDASAISNGLTSGFWVWFGFILAYLLTAPAFENRPWSYVFINGGYWLVGTLVSGVILGLWR
jgi:hypothetical protein